MLPGFGISESPIRDTLYCLPSDQDRKALVAMFKPCGSVEGSSCQFGHLLWCVCTARTTEGKGKCHHWVNAITREQTLFSRVAYGGPCELFTALVLL